MQTADYFKHGQTVFISTRHDNRRHAAKVQSIDTFGVCWTPQGYPTQSIMTPWGNVLQLEASL